jgi:hypothetical protein
MKKTTKDSEFTFIKEVTANQVEVLMLKIDSEIDLESLNFRIPQLKYLKFIPVGSTAILTIAEEPGLNKIFETLINNYFEEIHAEESIEHNLFVLKTKINEFLRLAEKDKGWNENQLKGFYAELLLLHSMLEKSTNKAETIAGWQRPNMANHDFTYNEMIHEVKAVGLHKNTVKITSEHQLSNPEGKLFLLEVFRIESLISKHEDSIGELYKQIIELLENRLQIDEFNSKCEADQIHYCGPNVHPLQFKFIIHEHISYSVTKDSFPRILPDYNTAISKVSYEIDLSAIEEFKN